MKKDLKIELKTNVKMKCLDFLKIKIDEQWLLLEEYWDYCKKHKFNAEEKILECKIKYLEKEYSWEEYNQNLKDTSKKFLPDTADNTYIKDNLFVFLYNKHYYRAIKFLEQVGFNISTACYYANKSYNKIPETLDRKTSYASCFFRRCSDFNTAIMWYNTCLDYLLQSVCARFNLYSELTVEDTSNMDFSELVKLCTFDNMAIASRNHKNDREFCVCRRALYICKQNLSKITNATNNLKHRGGLKLSNFELDCIMEIIVGEDKNTEFFKIEKIDIDKDFNLLVDAHNSIVNCYNLLLNKLTNEINIAKENFEKSNSKE